MAWLASFHFFVPRHLPKVIPRFLEMVIQLDLLSPEGQVHYKSESFNSSAAGKKQTVTVLVFNFQHFPDFFSPFPSRCLASLGWIAA